MDPPWSPLHDPPATSAPDRSDAIWSGKVTSQDFLRAGKAWTFSRGAMTEGLTFRIRAGDALTETFHAEVLPRIRILALRHSVRFPGYARQPQIKREVLI